MSTNQVADFWFLLQARPRRFWEDGQSHRRRSVTLVARLMGELCGFALRERLPAKTRKTAKATLDRITSVKLATAKSVLLNQVISNPSLCTSCHIPNFLYSHKPSLPAVHYCAFDRCKLKTGVLFDMRQSWWASS